MLKINSVLWLFAFIFLSLHAQELIVPLPQSIDVNKQKALLGKKLFLDTRLSKDDSISCNTCHNLEDWGDDGLSVSFGVEGQQGSVNSPTVFNARFNFSQFWDGRSKNLSEQAVGPIHNPVEMATTLQDVVKKLKKDPHYVDEFHTLYSDGVTEKNIIDAIVEFEKSLVTPDSRFDRYLRGEKYALNHDEIEGYKLFKDFGCISCHNGVNVGGNLYQKSGVIFTPRERENMGRFNITGYEEDRYYFKVPTLRNIERTSPYFHHGRVFDLKQAIKDMAYYQLGRVLTHREVELIYKFLLTLNGKRPEILNDQN